MDKDKDDEASDKEPSTSKRTKRKKVEKVFKPFDIPQGTKFYVTNPPPTTEAAEPPDRRKSTGLQHSSSDNSVGDKQSPSMHKVPQPEPTPEPKPESSSPEKERDVQIAADKLRETLNKQNNLFSPDVIHLSDYRRRRRRRLGGPTISLALGVVRKRSFTDVIFVVVFVLYAGIMIFIITRSMYNGNPKRLVNGIDSYGNACGTKNAPIEGANLSGKDFKYFPYIFTWKRKAAHSDPDTMYLCLRVCIEKDVKNVKTLQDIAAEKEMSLCRYDISLTEYQEFYRGTESKDDLKCPHLPRLKETPVFNRCQAERGSQGGQSGVCSEDIVMSTVVDVYNNVYNLLICIAIAVGLSLIMLLLMGFAPQFVVWTLYVGFMVVGYAGSFFCWYYFITLPNTVNTTASLSANSTATSTSMTNTGFFWLVAGIVVSAGTIVVFAVMISIHKYIPLVVLLFHEASKAIKQMPALLAQPLWTLLALVGICGLCVWAYLYLQTIYEFSVYKYGTVKFTQDISTNVLQVFYLIGLIWIVLIILVCEKLVVAGAVADWYFSRSKKYVKEKVRESTMRMLVFHIGLAICGSVVVSVTAVPRLLVGVCLDRAERRSNKCEKCCASGGTCYYRTLRYVSDFSYVMIAIYGCTFWQGCLKYYSVAVGTVDMLRYAKRYGSFVLLLGRLTTTVIQFVCAFWLINSADTEVCYQFVLLIISTVCTLLICHIFLTVYETTLNTLFTCYCEDISQNNGSSKPYFMSPELMKFLDTSKKEQEQESQV